MKVPGERVIAKVCIIIKRRLPCVDAQIPAPYVPAYFRVQLHRPCLYILSERRTFLRHTIGGAVSDPVTVKLPDLLTLVAIQTRSRSAGLIP